MANYGNSIGASKTSAVSVERINVWSKTYEFFPGGAVLAKSDTYPTGSIIYAGTPVAVSTPGGAATLNAASPIGLTYEDAVMGENAATFTVVTRGTFLVSRSKATITDAQQSALKGNIVFVKEV